MLLAAAICTGAGLFYAADWLSSADQPQKADAILVLGASYTRPFEASDPYHRGFAPKIYVGAPVRERQYRLLDEAGVPYPLELAKIAYYKLGGRF